ncbi:PEP-CTERM sorting domain-containing protein [Thalassobacterium maritimum]|uniref:PEP-CTERM sorting domain-containing protein n=1 Tax=Thalassobacterium maritimum TaxID=3041265 RepID=UPI0031F30C4F
MVLHLVSRLASGLVFANRNPNITPNANIGASVVLDNLTVTTVPEPGTYALLAGLSGLTFAMLRRRRA